ncbi:MAG: hypothetical protein QXO27_03545 [Candidatus Aenigmatarchaeota archaeon]
MSLQSQIQLCLINYQKWKDQALFSKDASESKKCMDRAFFWLELQTAFIVLSALEQTKGNDKEFKKKLIRAKTNLCKKLAEYAKELLDEIKL